MKLLVICVALLIPSTLQAFCFEDAEKACGIDRGLLETIAAVESNMNPNAFHRNRNGSSDLGLMQINSAWIDILKLDRDKLMSDPCYNVMTGAKILKQCIDRFGMEWVAVGCYNSADSQKRINYAWEVFQKLKTRGKRKMEEPEKREARSASSLVFTVRDVTREGKDE